MTVLCSIEKRGSQGSLVSRFKGPGGLSGRQIFEAVQRSNQIDAEHARTSPTSTASSNADDEARARVKRGSASGSQVDCTLQIVLILHCIYFGCPTSAP